MMTESGTISVARISSMTGDAAAELVFADSAKAAIELTTSVISVAIDGDEDRVPEIAR